MESALKQAHWHPSRGDAGYSLVEVLVTIVLMGTLMAIGFGSFRGWAVAKDHEGAAADLQTVLRQTQTRSITEGVSFCVTFNESASTYTVNRYACNTTVQKVNGPFKMNDSRVRLNDIRFRQPDGTTAPSITFRPTGTATPGRLDIVRDGSPTTYTVAIEGFTGRVSIF